MSFDFLTYVNRYISQVQRRRGSLGSTSSRSLFIKLVIESSMWIVNSSLMIVSSSSFGIASILSTASTILDWLKLIVNNRLAAAIWEGLNLKKHDSRCMNLQYYPDSIIICFTCLPLSLIRPKSLKNLSRKKTGETLRRSKSSDRIMFSSRLSTFFTFRVTECFYLRILIIRGIEGEIGSSIFAAMRMDATDRVTKHGSSYFFTSTCTRYLSAKLTAR